MERHVEIYVSFCMSEWNVNGEVNYIADWEGIASHHSWTVGFKGSRQIGVATDLNVVSNLTTSTAFYYTDF